MMDDPIKKLLESTGLSCDELLRKLQDYKSSSRSQSDDDLSTNSRELMEEKLKDAGPSGICPRGHEPETNREESVADVDSTSEDVEEICDTLEPKDEDLGNSSEPSVDKQTVQANCDKCHTLLCSCRTSTNSNQCSESVVEETCSIPKNTSVLSVENPDHMKIPKHPEAESNEPCSNSNFPAPKQDAVIDEPSENVLVTSLTSGDDPKTGTSTEKPSDPDEHEEEEVDQDDNESVTSEMDALKELISEQIDHFDSDLDNLEEPDNKSSSTSNLCSVEEIPKVVQKNISPDEVCCNEISSTELDEDETCVRKSDVDTEVNAASTHIQIEDDVIKVCGPKDSLQPDEAIVSSSIDNDSNNKTDLDSGQNDFPGKPSGSSSVDEEGVADVGQQSNENEQRSQIIESNNEESNADAPAFIIENVRSIDDENIDLSLSNSSAQIESMDDENTDLNLSSSSAQIESMDDENIDFNLSTNSAQIENMDDENIDLNSSNTAQIERMDDENIDLNLKNNSAQIESMGDENIDLNLSNNSDSAQIEYSYGQQQIKNPNYETVDLDLSDSSSCVPIESDTAQMESGFQILKVYTVEDENESQEGAQINCEPLESCVKNENLDSASADRITITECDEVVNISSEESICDSEDDVFNEEDDMLNENEDNDEEPRNSASTSEMNNVVITEDLESHKNCNTQNNSEESIKDSSKNLELDNVELPHVEPLDGSAQKQFDKNDNTPENSIQTPQGPEQIQESSGDVDEKEETYFDSENLANFDEELDDPQEISNEISNTEKQSESEDSEEETSTKPDEQDENPLGCGNENDSGDVSLEVDSIRNILKNQLHSLRNRKKQEHFKIDSRDVLNKVVNLNPKKKLANDGIMDTMIYNKNEQKCVDELIEMTDETNLMILDVVGGVGDSPQFSDLPETQSSDAFQTSPQNDEEIKLTKTNDITKIKGWKNKKFSNNKDVHEGNGDEDKADNPVEELRKIISRNKDDSHVSSVFVSDDIKKSCQALTGIEENSLNNETIEDIEPKPKSTESKTVPSMDDKISPFISNELDNFLNTNSSLQISYDIPKLDAEDGLTNSEDMMVPTTVLATEMKDNKELIDTSIAKPVPEIKAKTLAEKRRILEKIEKKRKKQLQKLGIKNEIKEEHGQKSKSGEMRGYVLYKNKKIWLPTKGGNALITKISDELINTKPQQKSEIYRRPSLLNELQRKSELTTKYRPAPLSKKVELYNQESNGCWKSYIKKMPKVYLEIMPVCGKKIPNKIQHFLPVFDWEISEVRANFALTALYDKKNKAPPKHFFKIPLQYANNQDSVIVKKKVSKYEVKPISPTIVQPVKKGSGSIEDEVKNIINDLLNYIETKEIEDSLIKPDEPYNYNEPYKKAGSHKPTEINENISTIVRKVSKKRKIDLELLRLNCKVVNVTLEESDENNCKQPYCQLGCVCQSLRCENVFTYHCRKVDCMFECTCPKQKSVNFDDEVILPAGTDLFSSDAVSKIDDRAKRNLARVEREFTQTIIYANDKTIVVSASGRCKPRRATRVPKKYTDYIEEDENKDKNSEIKFSIDDPKLKQKCDISLERLDLTNVIPYCLTHRKHGCFCGGTQPYVESLKDETPKERDRSPINIRGKEKHINMKEKETPISIKEKEKTNIKEKPRPRIIFKGLIEPVEDIETCARFKPVFAEFRERNRLPQHMKKLHKIIREQDFLSDATYTNINRDILSASGDIKTDADELKKSLLSEYYKKKKFVIPTKESHEGDSPSKVENKAMQRRKKHPKISIEPVQNSGAFETQAERLKAFIKAEESIKSSSSEEPALMTKKKKKKSKGKNTSEALLSSPVPKVKKSLQPKTIFDGEVIIPVDNNPDFMKVLGVDYIPEKFIRILPWINLINGYKSETIKVFQHEREPHKYIMCSSGENRIPKHFVPIEESAHAAVHKFPEWIIEGIVPIQRAFLYIVLVPFKRCFHILAFCLNSFDQKNNAMITVHLKENTVHKSDYLVQLKEAESLLLNKVKQKKESAESLLLNKVKQKKESVKNDQPSTSSSSPPDKTQFISMKELDCKQKMELNSLDKYVHKNQEGKTCILHLIQHLKGSAPLEFVMRIEEGEEDYLTNKADSGSDKISAWLPRCDGRWRMIYMRSDFAYLVFERSKYSIKYNDLKSIVKLACTLEKTVSLHNKTQMGVGYQSHYFGIYASFCYRDRIFIGPYGLDEPHGIETLRYMQGALVNTDLFNKMQGKPGNRIGVWLIQSEPSRTPVAGGAVTIDLTDDDRQSKTSKKTPSTVVVSPASVTPVKYRSILKRPSDSQESQAKKPKTDDQEVSLLPFSILPSDALKPSQYNRFILTNIPHLGYIGAHLDESSGELMVSWVFHKKTLKFDGVEKALAFLGTRLCMLLQPIPINFKVKFLLMKSVDHAVHKPIDSKYLYGHYICGEFGVYDVRTLTADVLQKIGVSREEVVDGLTKRVHAIVSHRMNELKCVLYGNETEVDDAEKILTDAQQTISDSEARLQLLMVEKGILEVKKNENIKDLHKVLDKLPQERRLVEYSKFKSYTSCTQRKTSCDGASDAENVDSSDIFYANKDNIAIEIPKKDGTSIGPLSESGSTKERNDDCIEIIDSDDDDCIPIEPEIPTIELDDDDVPGPSQSERPKLKTLSQVFGDKTEDNERRPKKKLTKIKLKPLPDDFKLQSVLKPKLSPVSTSDISAANAQPEDTSMATIKPIKPILSGVKLVKMKSGKLLLVKEGERKTNSPVGTKYVIKDNKIVSVAPITEKP